MRAQTTATQIDHLAGQLIDFDLSDGGKAWPAIYVPERFEGREVYQISIPLEMLDEEIAQHVRADRGRSVIRATSGRPPQVKPVLSTVELHLGNVRVEDLEQLQEYAKSVPLLPPGEVLQLVPNPLDLMVRELERARAQNLSANSVFAGRRTVAHTMLAVKGVNYEEAPFRQDPKPDACLWLQSITVYL